MPHVSYAAVMAGGAHQTRPGVTNAAAVATASCRPSSSTAPLHETSGQLAVESRPGVKVVNASVQSKTSVCIGEYPITVREEKDKPPAPRRRQKKKYKKKKPRPLRLSVDWWVCARITWERVNRIFLSLWTEFLFRASNSTSALIGCHHYCSSIGIHVNHTWRGSTRI